MILVSKRHNKYVLVMIEHFSQWSGLVALLGRFSEGTSYAFLGRVLNRFGAPIEVLINQGREFFDEFQPLLDQAYTDNRTTSHDHLKANGLAKRMVQTVKRA